MLMGRCAVVNAADQPARGHDFSGSGKGPPGIGIIIIMINTIVIITDIIVIVIIMIITIITNIIILNHGQVRGCQICGPTCTRPFRWQQKGTASYRHYY